MDIKQVYKSAGRFLSTEDLKGQEHRLKIRAIECETFTDRKTGKETEKTVVYFVGKNKGWICGKLCSFMIAEEWKSTETDDWIGGEIFLRPEKCQMEGQIVDCMRPRTAGPLPSRASADDFTQAPPNPFDNNSTDTPNDSF